jgi:CRISPR system Cascade subunit CasB
MPYVAPYLRREASRREEDALILVGGLFSMHPTQGGVSLASALRRRADESDSVALRFRALLDAEAEDLPTHLRHAISLVRAYEIPIDYDDLLRAILAWSRDDRRAQRTWARHFWGVAPSTTPDTPETETKA